MKSRTDKERRYAKIKEIIARRPIETQQALTEALREENIAVTQATVSRDIKKLMLIKVPTASGSSRYAAPGEERGGALNRLEQLIAEAVVSLDYSENLIVLKTMPGAANAVASALDRAEWPEIIGTLAGDDNIIVVVKPKEAVPACFKKMTAMWGGV